MRLAVAALLLLSAAAPPELVGTLVSPQQRRAVFRTADGAQVAAREGDRVAACVVRAIAPGGARIACDGTDLTVTLRRTTTAVAAPDPAVALAWVPRARCCDRSTFGRAVNPRAPAPD